MYKKLFILLMISYSEFVTSAPQVLPSEVPIGNSPQGIPAQGAQGGAQKPPDMVTALRSTPVTNGYTNLSSDDVFNHRVQMIQKLYKDGKISATGAVDYINNMQTARNAQLKEKADLAKIEAETALAQAQADKIKAEIQLLKK